jgi:hypothetical protein
MRQIFKTLKDTYSETPNEIIGGVVILILWGIILFVSLYISSIIC